PAAAPRGGGEEAAPAVGETAAEPRVAAARPAPGKPAKAAAKAPPASEGNAPPPAWNQALVVINEAKGFSPGARDAEMRAAMALSKDPVGQQFLEDQRVGTSVKQALTSLRSQGRATTLEEEKRAVADALAAGGVEPTEEEVNLQLARADAPPTPDISAQEALAILESIRAAPDHLPLTEFPHPPFPEEPDDAAEEEAQEAAEEAQPGEAPRAPAARPRLPPPPGNAQRAYAMTRAALERARQRWGVAPEHPLAIFWQETNFGRFLGGGPVAASLRREVERYRPGTARYRQAVRDQAALVRLQAAGELGRYNASNIIGSSPGASFGYTQFRPSSYEAYGRSADGGRRDPFDASDAVYSSANYLQIHGYRRDPARAFWHYNHDPAYVRAVQNKGARIRQHVIDPARR
ncbi:MAG: lytic murein transglycosylase, partial [Elusimicrobiota bacterium]|nr:lytic murein transglycosylase [Elusimicrobiota bacterium]